MWVFIVFGGYLLFSILFGVFVHCIIDWDNTFPIWVKNHKVTISFFMGLLSPITFPISLVITLIFGIIAGVYEVGIAIYKEWKK